MNFSCSRLARAILGFSLIIFVAGSLDAKAQEIPGSATRYGLVQPVGSRRGLSLIR